MAGKILSEDWWECIWLVSSIMQYKITTEQEASKDRQIKTHEEVDDIHQHIQIVNKKLDLIMEKLQISFPEMLDKI